MKPPKRVSETFETTLWLGTSASILGIREPWVRINVGFKDGDRVRVKVTKLERGK